MTAMIPGYGSLPMIPVPIRYDADTGYGKIWLETYLSPIPNIGDPSLYSNKRKTKKKGRRGGGGEEEDP